MWKLDFNRWGLIGIAALYSYLITHPKPPVLFAVPFFFSLVVYWHLFEQHKTVVDIAEYIKEIEGWIAAGRPNGPGGPEGWEVNLGPSKDRPPSTWWPLRNDALAAELAGVLENDLAVALVMLIKHDAKLRPAYQLCQLALAILNR